MTECMYRSKLTGFGGPKTTATASASNVKCYFFNTALPIYIEKVKSPSPSTSSKTTATTTAVDE